MAGRIKILFVLLLLTTFIFAQEARDNIDFEAIEQQAQESKKADYQFETKYRMEIGYIQPWQHSRTDSYPDMYSHGLKVGATVDFMLPYKFSVQTGLYYAVTYGVSKQHFRTMIDQFSSEQVLNNRVLKHDLMIPMRVGYNPTVWKDLSLFFYGGPQMIIGLGQTDYVKAELTDDVKTWLEKRDVRTGKYDKYKEKELSRFNIQLGVGGGIGWKQYRIVSGYDFGLNNLVRRYSVPTAVQDLDAAKRQMWEWGWYVSFSYGF